MDGTFEGDRENCPVEATLRLIGGKWRMFVLFRLGEGPMRFNALQRSLAPVTQRVLTATLRGLEDDGLVWRTVHETVPPHVEYGLTDRGRRWPRSGPRWRGGRRLRQVARTLRNCQGSVSSMSSGKCCQRSVSGVQSV